MERDVAYKIYLLTQRHIAHSTHKYYLHTQRTFFQDIMYHLFVPFSVPLSVSKLGSLLVVEYGWGFSLTLWLLHIRVPRCWDAETCHPGGCRSQDVTKLHQYHGCAMYLMFQMLRLRAAGQTWLLHPPPRHHKTEWVSLLKINYLCNIHYKML